MFHSANAPPMPQLLTGQHAALSVHPIHLAGLWAAQPTTKPMLLPLQQVHSIVLAQQMVMASLPLAVTQALLPSLVSQHVRATIVTMKIVQKNARAMMTKGQLLNVMSKTA